MKSYFFAQQSHMYSFLLLASVDLFEKKFNKRNDLGIYHCTFLVNNIPIEVLCLSKQKNLTYKFLDQSNC